MAGITPSAVSLVSLSSTSGGLSSAGAPAQQGNVASAPHAPDGFEPSAPDQLRAFVAQVRPPHDLDPTGDAFADRNEPLRTELERVRKLQSELAGLPAANPRRATLEQALSKASAQLEAASGYTADDAPVPGALWVSPELLDRELVGGKVTASHFPVGKAVRSPPDPLDRLFKGYGRRVDLGTPAEYVASVARARSEAGMPALGGRPIGVHLSLDSGGGKGKRFIPAVEEMVRLGLVPTAFTGTSAGAIGAAILAASPDPSELDAVSRDPAFSKFFDLDLFGGHGGLADGKVAFDTFDRVLRALTGIRDRPVTFADLPVPLQILATRTSDSGAKPGEFDDPKKRLFVFSQETTPDTPVALAVRASMGISFVFAPVRVQDPTTGRRMALVDGGTLNCLPLGYGHDGLPEVALGLPSPGDTNPEINPPPHGKPPRGNLDTHSALWAGLDGWALLEDGAAPWSDFKRRSQPGPGRFVLELPTWNLEHPREGDSILGFTRNKADPALDEQTRTLVDGFFKSTSRTSPTPAPAAPTSIGSPSPTVTSPWTTSRRSASTSGPNAMAVTRCGSHWGP